MRTTSTELHRRPYPLVKRDTPDYVCRIGLVCLTPTHKPHTQHHLFLGVLIRN